MMSQNLRTERTERTERASRARPATVTVRGRRVAAPRRPEWRSLHSQIYHVTIVAGDVPPAAVVSGLCLHSVPLSAVACVVLCVPGGDQRDSMSALDLLLSKRDEEDPRVGGLPGSAFTALPGDLSRVIVLYLDAKDVIALAMCCHQLCQVRAPQGRSTHDKLSNKKCTCEVVMMAARRN